MADYHSPTVVEPTIPTTDMTAVEQLLLSHVFEFEEDGDGLYFFAEICLEDMPVIEIDDVRKALAEGGGTDCRTADFLRDQLTRLNGDDDYLQLDAEIPWETAFQDIVRRSATIEHVEVISSFTCTKMRPDGFGGAVTVITADQVLSSSTEQMTGELLDRAQYGELDCAPGHGCHVLLRLAEEDVRATLGEFFETEAPPSLAVADVTDADIREACFAIREHVDLSHEAGEAAFNAAMRALRIAAEREGAAP